MTMVASVVVAMVMWSGQLSKYTWNC